MLTSSCISSGAFCGGAVIFGIRCARPCARQLIAAAGPDALAFFPIMIAVPVSRRSAARPWRQFPSCARNCRATCIVIAGFRVEQNRGDLLLMGARGVKAASWKAC